MGPWTLRAGRVATGDGGRGPRVRRGAQVAAFLDDYALARPGPLDGRRAAAAAAACWVMAYNARCETYFLAPGADPVAGSALHALGVAGRGYLDLA